MRVLKETGATVSRRKGWPRRPLVALASLGCATALFLPLRLGQAQAQDDGDNDDTSDEASAFTECVRSNGVPDFPGVTITDDGRLLLDGSDVNPFSSDYREAMSECFDLLPDGSGLPPEPNFEMPELEMPEFGSLDLDKPSVPDLEFTSPDA